VLQAPMMAVPVPQPAKGKTPWLLIALFFVLGFVLAAVALLIYFKHLAAGGPPISPPGAAG